MPLTRAQLLMGNDAQGTLLFDQVQGVREATPPDGIVIDLDGTIHFDAASSRGSMKLNNPNAYNGYVWPTAPGSNGQQLEIDGSGNLFWADADGIDWTMKGQLLVGTGVGPTQDTLLNPPGQDRWVLRSNNGTVSGLEWSPLYVEILQDLQGAAVMPRGSTAERPSGPAGGWTRYNYNSARDPILPAEFLEYYDAGTGTWQQLATFSQVKSTTLRGDSKDTGGNGGVNDIPQEPGFLVRETIFVPAGYNKMLIIASIAFSFSYSTANTMQAGVLSIAVDGAQTAYQALNTGNNPPNFLQMAVSISNFFDNPSLGARTVQARVAKSLPPGPVATNDSTLTIFAWRDVP